MYTCPVSVTVIRLPSWSVQEKGMSSLSTPGPFSPLLQAQFLFFGELCAKESTIREDNKCFIEQKEKKCLGRNVSASKVKACLGHVSVLFCSTTEHAGRLTCVWCHSFLLGPKNCQSANKDFCSSSGN